MAVLTRQLHSPTVAGGLTDQARQMLATQGITNPTVGKVNTLAMQLGRQGTQPIPQQTPQQPTDLYSATKQIMQNKYGMDANYQGTQSQQSYQQLADILMSAKPTTSRFDAYSQTPGFKNLDMAGVSNLYNIISGGEQKRAAQTYSGLRDYLGSIGNVVAGEQKLLKEKESKLADRRQNAIDEYISFKQKIINEGGTPDAKAGQDLIGRISKSNNPEQELSDYLSTAAPFVKRLFAPKGTGGTIVDRQTKALKEAAALAKSMVDGEFWTQPEADAYVKQFTGHIPVVGNKEKTAQDILDDPQTFIDEARNMGDSDQTIVNDLIAIGMSPSTALSLVTGKSSSLFVQNPESGLTPIGEELKNIFYPKKPTSSIPYPDTFLSAPKK